MIIVDSGDRSVRLKGRFLTGEAVVVTLIWTSPGSG